MTTYTRRAVPASRPLPSRGVTLADWLDECDSEDREIRAANKASEAEGCRCCCCTGTCNETEEEEEEEEEQGDSAPLPHWQDEGEGVYSFSVVTSWYDGPTAWFVPEGWFLLNTTPEDGDRDYLKHHETAERVRVRRLPLRSPRTLPPFG